jgi:DNA ligase (NAD+)
MEKKTAKERVEKLKKEISKYRYQYHVLDRLEISERALDSLKHELKKLEERFPDLVTPDSPTQRVAGKPLPGFKKVGHKQPMLSLEDAFSPEELESWHERIQKLLPKEKMEFFAELKIDGFAISLVYKKGFLETGSTRGDGKTGEDVTQNLKTIEAIPLKLEAYAKFPSRQIERKAKQIIQDGEFEIRGEVFMSKGAFEEVNRQRKKKGQSLYANPRNLAAGSIRQLDPKLAASRKLNFIAYDIVTDLGQKLHSEKHQIARALGFKTSQEEKVAKNLDQVINFWQRIQKVRESLPHQIDGIVVSVDQVGIYERLGVVGKAPRGAIAFKFPAQEATTTVEDVVVRVGRTGTLTPIAVLAPVNIGGVTVKRATLHNLDEIKRLDVKIGDTVIVQRAGDVIPAVVGVLAKLRPKNAKDFKMPAKCPVCNAAIVREGAYFRSANNNCPALKREHLYHFTSKKAFNILGLGPKILDRLYDEGLIGDAADIFDLKEDDIEGLERFGEKSAENLVNSIGRAKEISLSRLIYSLGILHVGEETANDLAEHFGSLGKIKEASFEKLQGVPNIGAVVAKSLYEWFNNKANERFLGKLLGKDLKIINPKTLQKSGRLKGLKFVFTGELEKLSRQEAQVLVRNHGGSLSSSVSKNTNYVVVGSHCKTCQTGFKRGGEEKIRPTAWPDFGIHRSAKGG